MPRKTLSSFTASNSTDADTDADAADDNDDIIHHDTDPPQLRRERRRVRLDDLTLNPENAKLFDRSRLDFQDVKLSTSRYGHRHPIEVTPDMVIVDGERRYRDHRARGDEEIEVVVLHGLEGDDAVLLYMIDCWASTKDPLPSERVSVYNEALKALRAQHGRPPGRPGNSGSDDPEFWSTEQIRSEAARIARLGSATSAKKANYVWKHGDYSVQEAVDEGRLTISAAHKEVKEARAAERRRREEEERRASGKAGSEGTDSDMEDGEEADAADADHEDANDPGEGSGDGSTGSDAGDNEDDGDLGGGDEGEGNDDDESNTDDHSDEKDLDEGDDVDENDADQGEEDGVDGNGGDDREPLSDKPFFDEHGKATTWKKETEARAAEETDPDRIARSLLDALWTSLVLLKRLEAVGAPSETLGKMLAERVEEVGALADGLMGE